MAVTKVMNNLGVNFVKTDKQKMIKTVNVCLK